MDPELCPCLAVWGLCFLFLLVFSSTSCYRGPQGNLRLELPVLSGLPTGRECPAELKAFWKSRSIRIRVPLFAIVIACCCTQRALCATICTLWCARNPYWEPSITAYFSEILLIQLVVMMLISWYMVLRSAMGL